MVGGVNHRYNEIQIYIYRVNSNTEGPAKAFTRIWVWIDLQLVVIFAVCIDSIRCPLVYLIIPDLFIHLLRQGDYDEILTWPFRQKVTLCLLDQVQNKRHVMDTFRPDPASSSFKKPNSAMNVASGCPLFIPLSTLENANEPYLRNETIFIKVVVDTSDLVNCWRFFYYGWRAQHDEMTVIWRWFVRWRIARLRSLLVFTIASLTDGNDITCRWSMRGDAPSMHCTILGDTMPHQWQDVC